MLVMGLDTALQRCSVAIMRGETVYADFASDMERGHAEHLAPMAAQALAQARVSVRDLDRVGVVVGPGGFTGVRVALSFARGLGVGTGIPVIGVTSLAALAANITPSGANELVAAIIDARRGQVYAALFDPQANAVLAEPFVADPASAHAKLKASADGRDFLLTGSGAPLLDRASSGAAQIDAKVVARLAARAPHPATPPAPLYLRAPDAKPGKPPLFQTGPGA
ncbi:tRNA (adenosine(37)-N6)-threonylcarbamoyltransferase complex dimerization subunit type 1 TsaB [Hyphococcus sp.]|uniref:tRNA (adenosine(37)-N6)-threonylcarbamoyltransferase complex dimerization subunit type 1 TsaB n=1 Tax=Hyphococcus sp. TaxID=2038636 RepID=UPI003CCBF4F0